MRRTSSPAATCRPTPSRASWQNISANIGDLQAIASAMKGVTPKEMGQDVGVPMHEGAKAFYEEQGAS